MERTKAILIAGAVTATTLWGRPQSVPTRSGASQPGSRLNSPRQLLSRRRRPRRHHRTRAPSSSMFRRRNRAAASRPAPRRSTRLRPRRHPRRRRLTTATAATAALAAVATMTTIGAAPTAGPAVAMTTTITATAAGQAVATTTTMTTMTTTMTTMTEATVVGRTMTESVKRTCRHAAGDTEVRAPRRSNRSVVADSPRMGRIWSTTPRWHPAGPARWRTVLLGEVCPTCRSIWMD